MIAAQDTVVHISYVLRDAKGEILDESSADDAFEYLQGHQNIVPGLEKAIAGTVNMTYMGVTRSGPAIVCPKCGDSWVEEYLATKTIAAAEGLFEKKKA